MTGITRCLQACLAFQLCLLEALPRKNEDLKNLLVKELQNIEANQARLVQDVAFLRQELIEVSDVIRIQIPTDCSGAKLRGSWESTALISPPGLSPRKVRCEQFAFGGGWTVVVVRNTDHIMKEKKENSKFVVPDGTNKRKELWSRLSSLAAVQLTQEEILLKQENFNRSWSEYKEGFGDPRKEYWLGNEVLHALTNERPWEASVTLEDWNGRVAFALWDSFRVLNEESGYKLEISGYRNMNSTLKDGLAYHNGKPFSTIDSDNDGYKVHCAREYGGGWWFHQCHVSLLTGTHLLPGSSGQHAVHYLPWNNNNESLKKVALMIRPPKPQ